MERKGQAAMEFLMTYGWAILAAVIAIGVLAYFGVFSPGKYVGSAIIINSPFGTTQEFSIMANNISFVLRNGAGESVDISSITIGAGCANNTAMTLLDGDAKLIFVPCTTANSGKINEDIKITYKLGEKLVDLTGTGSVRGTVAA